MGQRQRKAKQGMKLTCFGGHFHLAGGDGFNNRTEIKLPQGATVKFLSLALGPDSSLDQFLVGKRAQFRGYTFHLEGGEVFQFSPWWLPNVTVLEIVDIP